VQSLRTTVYAERLILLAVHDWFLCLLNERMTDVIQYFLFSSQREWDKRMEALPDKIIVAYLKYHAVILLMRLYEHIASKFVDEEKLDELTLDTFEAAKRRANAGKDGLAREMVTVCWKANAISFLADYSVHQVIIAYGYYKIIQERRRKIKNGDGYENTEGNDESLGLSFMKKSTMLALSRGVSLYFASVGGALGTTLWPGWGTLAGTNFGDSLALTFFE